jgi:hypothetical protein
MIRAGLKSIPTPQRTEMDKRDFTPTQLNIKTNIVDPTQTVILAEWYSLGERPAAISRDLGFVLSRPESYTYTGACPRCGSGNTGTTEHGSHVCYDCGKVWR